MSKTKPVPTGLMNLLGERISNPKLGDTKTLARQPAQPPREYRAEEYTPEQWSQGKSQTHRTSDELQSVRAGRGQRRGMRVYPQQTEGYPQR